MKLGFTISFFSFTLLGEMILLLIWLNIFLLIKIFLSIIFDLLSIVCEDKKKDFGEIMVQLKFNYDSYLPSQKIINEINTNEEEDKINNDRFLKNLDIQTWKIEVDLENIGDIINRFKASENPGLLNNLKSMFQGLI